MSLPPQLDRELGRLYGYPDCCVEAFIDKDQWSLDELVRDHIAHTMGRPWNGTGFVPCSACRAQAAADFAAFVANVITPNRAAISPFPESAHSLIQRAAS